ncbi:efflux RND transporter periplasmic adaptor subunit [Desulfopila sp. IMCC35006]|nr:efflux RND transporter periplasmic adaptor subunit [Desulfopila sp. IMCC35006]
MMHCPAKIFPRKKMTPVHGGNALTGALGLVFLFFSFCSPVWATEMATLRPYARQISFTGFTRPIQELTIAAEVSGTYTAVSVDVGDVVGTGGVVAEIDATFVRLALQKNKIARQQAELELVLAKKNLARFQNLIDKKSTAQATYDETVLRAEILDLTLENLKNEQENLTEQLQRHTLRAPVGWSVIKRHAEPGEYVRQGEPILKLGNFQSVCIPFLFTYEELALVRGMARLHVFLPDLHRKVEAEIYRVSPDFDEKSRKIGVDLRIRPKEMAANPGLRGGVRAQLTLEGNREKNSFLIEATALVSRYDAHWLVAPDGAQRKVLFLGMTLDGKEAIVNSSECRPGDQFMLRPGPSLKN